ncbi:MULTISPECIES: hypothetical protein [Hymenobacter]|uniref:Uncharacterized protein n=1 Tax=Hymenobacter psychrotolerans DSM 18569 TaxID=1121959 RepID=A0A1M6ZXL5_9BACT|nr:MULTISPECIES: hypothetical protein [Hymenobacter]QNE42155.1 hypothetical protein F1C16_21295 [Hymenobacter sp. NBH84]SHL35156.1 hypothetical protein SAMN02746009_02601 [Hymenobacter psychrotolerans DSM 18569]
MKTPEERHAHLETSKAMLDEAMNEAGLSNGSQGSDRLDEFTSNLNKLAASKAMDVANARLGEFEEALTAAGLPADAVVAETEDCRTELIHHLRQLIRERL